MNEPEDLRWSWEKTDPDRSQTSGDVAKLFKNEPVKAPGVFAADQPSPDATVLAREVIQNSWDAAGELRVSCTPPRNSRSPSISALWQDHTNAS